METRLVLKNARHERFCRAMASGKSQLESYLLAGYSKKGHKSSASKLANREDIKRRIANLLEDKANTQREAVIKAAEELKITKMEVLRELWDNSQQAKAAVPVLDREGNPTGQYQANWAASNRALELVGKELGMFIDRKEIRTGALDGWTAEQLERLIAALEHEPGDSHHAGEAGSLATGSGIRTTH
jgi:hypothetical protein